MSADNMEARLRKSIEEGGFPLELKVVDIFRGQKWHVTPSAFYVDRDEQKGREIDAHATLIRTLTIPDGGQAVFACTISVECKTSASPFVVFCSTGDGLWPPSLRIVAVPGPLAVGSDEKLEEDAPKPIPHSPERAVERNAPWYQDLSRRTGHSMVQPHTKGGGQDRHAIHQAVKAALHTAHEKESQRNHDSGNLHLFLPMVVIDAPLFEAHLEKGELKLERVKHSIVQHNYVSPHYDGLEPMIPGYMVDVVPVEALPSFVKDTVEPSLKKIAFEHFDIKEFEPKRSLDGGRGET